MRAGGRRRGGVRARRGRRPSRSRRRRRVAAVQRGRLPQRGELLAPAGGGVGSGEGGVEVPQVDVDECGVEPVPVAGQADEPAGGLGRGGARPDHGRHLRPRRPPTRPPEPINFAEHRIRRKQVLSGLTHEYYIAV
jgi:hypothetical protein